MDEAPNLSAFGANITKLRGENTLNEWCARYKLSQPALHRIVSGKRGGNIATVLEVAEAIGMEPWQLLHPTMGWSPYAMEIARMFDAIADNDARDRLYAMITWMLERSNDAGPQTLPPSGSPKLLPPSGR